MAEPPVAVLVCTMNRPEHVATAVRSVLASEYTNFDLLVLDQGAEGEGMDSLRALLEADPRARHVKLPLPGKPLALNHGLAACRGVRFVLLTDDDCEVSPGWIREMVHALESDETVGCVFGDVRSGPLDAAAGYIPCCHVNADGAIHHLDEFITMPGWRNWGMGASVGFRAEALRAIGGWDPCIGPGTRFGSGDDNDVVVNLLRAGHGVGFRSSAFVLHHGFRYWASRHDDLERTAFGLGAIFAKHLRQGVVYTGALRVFAEFARAALGEARQGKRPDVTYPVSWLHGALSGLAHPLDDERRFFASAPGRRGRTYFNRSAPVVPPST